MEETLTITQKYNLYYHYNPPVSADVLYRLQLITGLLLLFVLYLQIDKCKCKSGDNKLKREYV
jgi:hypothetical protein